MDERVGEGVPGYVTPKVAVGAVVGNDEGEILLVQRADSGIWLYPTGWADIGYSASEVAVKEVRRRPASSCEVVAAASPCSTACGSGFTRVPLYSLVFHCRAIGGELTAHPLETRRRRLVRGRRAAGAARRLPSCGASAFAAIRGERSTSSSTPPRPPWQAPTTT